MPAKDQKERFESMKIPHRPDNIGPFKVRKSKKYTRKWRICYGSLTVLDRINFKRDAAREAYNINKPWRDAITRLNITDGVIPTFRRLKVRAEEGEE